MDERAVVTGFLRNDGDVLLLERSEDVGSDSGRWGGVAGHAEGDPDAAVRQEIREETGIDPEKDCTLVRRGEQFDVTDEDLERRWQVHPYLFDCETRDVEPNWETTAFEWVAPTEILRRETVLASWRSYDRVRPGPETIASDTAHGSAFLSIRALEVLRDECALLAAGRPAAYDSPSAVAAALLAARPSMTVLSNRLNRAMAQAAKLDPAAVEAAASAVLDAALAADTEAAARAATEIQGRTIATLSRSGTVLDAIAAGGPDRVVVPASRPGGEGVEVAEALAEESEVILTSDAGFAQQLAAQNVEILLVGADSITPAGDVINKVGTRGGAAAAAQEDIRVLVVAASDKTAPAGAVGAPDLEPRGPAELYRGEASLTVVNDTFDVTPASLVDGIVTEDGRLDSAAVRERADAHEQWRGWR